MQSGRMRNDARSFAERDPARGMSLPPICGARRRDWRAMGACAGVFTALASLPLCGFAQTQAAASAAQPPTPLAVQPLAETRVDIPLSAAIAQTSGAALELQPLTVTRKEIPLSALTPQTTTGATTLTPTGTGGNAQAAAPAEPRPSEKQERKAERLYLQGAKLLDANDCHGAYETF